MCKSKNPLLLVSRDRISSLMARWGGGRGTLPSANGKKQKGGDWDRKGKSPGEQRISKPHQKRGGG